jgi:hypothetical protein
MSPRARPEQHRLEMAAAVRGVVGMVAEHVESGAVAAAFGDTVSAVSGGLACMAGALVLARLLPGFRRQQVAPSDRSGGTP